MEGSFRHTKWSDEQTGKQLDDSCECDLRYIRTALTTAESRGYERGLAAAVKAVESNPYGTNSPDKFEGWQECRYATLKALQALSKQE